MIHDAALVSSSPHAGPLFSPRTRALFATAAVVATFAAVIALFAISAIALESRGIGYESSGGGLLAKFHPATPLALLALALRCLSAGRPLATAWRLVTDDPGIVTLGAAIFVAGCFAVGIDKTPVTPLVDTFVLPAVVFLLLRDLEPRLLRWLAFAVVALLAVNAVIAIGEFLRGTHLIKVAVPDGVSADPTRPDATFSWQAMLALDWRASALLGHPLVNGLIVGSFTLCLAAPGASWMPIEIRAPMIALAGISMFAFGARTALVLTILFGAWFVVVQAVEALERGARIVPRGLAVAVFAGGALVVGALLLAQTGFLDKTLERFANDSGSASTRLTMFSLFDPMALSDIVLKPDQDIVSTWQRLLGLEFGIESSWIGLVLTYGLVVASIVALGILAFCASLWRTAGRGAAIVLVFYLVQVSVTASLSGKTTTFAMVVALLLLFLRHDASRFPARRDRSV